MKEINLYVRGSCKNKEDMRGCYCGILEYKGREKIVKGTSATTTSNRMMLIGVLKCLDMLKEPCVINLHVPAHLGFTRGSKSVNKDLIREVTNRVTNGGHTLIEIVSQDRQYELSKITKRLYFDVDPDTIKNNKEIVLKRSHII